MPSWEVVAQVCFAGLSCCFISRRLHLSYAPCSSFAIWRNALTASLMKGTRIESMEPYLMDLLYPKSIDAAECLLGDVSNMRNMI